jgi:hypothetical protein
MQFAKLTDDVSKTIEDIRMRLKKLFFGFFTLVFIVGAILALATFYFYRHPSAVKSVIEKTISAKTGVAFTIENLSYSLAPLSIRAKNISITDGKTARGIDLKIPHLTANFNLTGTFGQKKLIIQYLNISSFSLYFNSEIKLPEIVTGAKPPSLFNRILKRITGYIFFREIQIRSADIVNGKIKYRSAEQQLFLQQIKARLNNNQMDVSGRAEIHWTVIETIFHVPSFIVTAVRDLSAGESTIDGRLIVSDATFDSSMGQAEDIAVNLHLTFDSLLRQIAFDEAMLQCKRVFLNPKTDRTIWLEALHFNTQGFYQLSEKKLLFSHWRLAIKNLLKLNGKADLRLIAPYHAKITLSESQLISQRLISTYQELAGLSTLPLAMSGPLRLSGYIEAQKDKPKWVYQGDMAVQLTQNRVTYGSGQDQFEGWISGNLRINGQLPSPQLSAKLKGNHITFVNHHALLKPFKADISLSGRYPVFSVTDLRTRIPGVSIALGKKDYQIDDLKIRLKKGNFNLQSGSFSWPEILLSTSTLQNLRMSLTGQLNQMLLILNGKNSRFLDAAVALNLLPANWQFTAVDSLQVRATIRRGDWSTISSKLELANFNFNNPNESCIAENIRALAEINAMYHIKEAKMEAALSLSSTKGELLCDKFYHDLTKNNFFISGNGVYRAALKNFQLNGLRIGLQGLMVLDLNGNFFNKAGQPKFDLSINIPRANIHPIFNLLISEPFKYEKPALAALQVGGSISARLNLMRNGPNWSLTGKSFWQKGSLVADATGISLKDINIDLPVWYQTRQRTTASNPMKGSLSIQKMILPFLPPQSVLFPFKVRPAGIVITDSTPLLFQTGEIQFGPIFCKNIFDSQLSVETSLTLNAVTVDPYLERVWPNPTGGVLQGKLENINFDGRNVTSQGQITLDIFGGQIIIDNPGFSSIFSSAPVIKLSAQVSDLSLAELTGGTSFGKIQGTLSGYIKDLEVVNGQPQKFELLLETVPKKNTVQKINVKAVENIARIGGESSPFSGLAGTFVSFFKDFYYQKIGMVASLENDRFKINGTVKEGGVEYFVKKGGIPGVDVVNTNLNNRISFKDMVKRIKRIKDTQAEPIVQ